MKEKLNLMLKALNVNKVIFYSLIVFIISCAPIRPDIVDNTYKLDKYKSKSGFTKVIINAYENEIMEALPANVKINNLSFQIKSKNDQIIPLEIITFPNSKLNIEISSIGLHTVKVKEVYLKKGDSVIINAYLKKDNRPLH